MTIILNTYITSKWFNIDNKIVNHHRNLPSPLILYAN